MKNIMIAIVTVGAAIAGLILYVERKNRSRNKVTDAAGDAYKTVNNSIGSLDRPAYHAMG